MRNIAEDMVRTKAGFFREVEQGYVEARKMLSFLFSKLKATSDCPSARFDCYFLQGETRPNQLRWKSFLT
ncbi:MAG: hypothetical protein SWO11_17030 [Thermodesulfobacteriota bacterium]|nr:hypothetical protein [Thermodesulfobacteriota bacterium]